MKHWKTMMATSIVLAMAAGTVLAEQQEQQRGRQGNRQRQRSMRGAGAPKVGDAAPTFKLKSLDGEKETDLASFKGKKPTMLIFGSYT